MNDEKRKKANDIHDQISKLAGDLVVAKLVVLPAYYRDGYTRIIPVSNDIKKILQLIVVSSLEDELSKLQAEYDSL